MNLTVTVQTQFLSLEKLQPEWNKLLRNSQADSIFLTWEWINTWWKVYGDQYTLYILTVRDSDEHLLGIGPLKIAERKLFPFRKLMTLEFIGYGDEVTPEYLNFIIKKGHEKNVMLAILKYLFQNSECEIFDFRPISNRGSIVSNIEKFLTTREIPYLIKEDSNCPVADLPNSWSEFVAGKSRNFRKKMKEYHRRVDKDLNVCLRKCESVNAMKKYFNELVKLHNNRWNESSKAFNNKRYVDFHKIISKEFLKKDWLRLFLLQDGEKPIAGIYCYFYNDQYYYYQSGRDLKYNKYRVGTILLNKVIEEAIKEGATLFDFLTGTESYKFHWSSRVRRNINLIFWKSKKEYILSKLYSIGNRILRIPFYLLQSKK